MLPRIGKREMGLESGKNLTGGRLWPYHGNKGAKIWLRWRRGGTRCPPRRTHPGVRPDKRARVCGFVRPRGTWAEKGVPKREIGNEDNGSEVSISKG
jgi:hypothetical protein